MENNNPWLQWNKCNCHSNPGKGACRAAQLPAAPTAATKNDLTPGMRWMHSLPSQRMPLLACLVMFTMLAVRTVGAGPAVIHAANVRGGAGGIAGGTLFLLLFQDIPRSKANGPAYIYLDEICFNVTKIVSGRPKLYVKVRSSSPPIVSSNNFRLFLDSSRDSVGY